MLVQTPAGPIEIGRRNTPSSGATVAVAEIKRRFKKLAKFNLFPLETIADATSKSSQQAENK